MQFEAGERVRVKEAYHWAKGATGTVRVPPDAVKALVGSEAPWHGCRRTVKGVKGPILFFWVEFDDEQIDADGDGPYQAGEMEAEFLERETLR